VPDPSRAADNRAPRWRMKPGAENTFKHTALTKLADRERRSRMSRSPWHFVAISTAEHSLRR